MKNNEKVFIDKRIIRIQHDIQELLKLDNGVSVHFETKSWGDENNKHYLVRVYTYNVHYDYFFLLFECQKNSQIQAWLEVDSYVKQVNKVFKGKILDGEKDNNVIDIGNSYTIEWSSTTQKKRLKSYFYAKDEMAALNKFYHGKDKKDYTVFEVKLNPLS